MTLAVLAITLFAGQPVAYAQEPVPTRLNPGVIKAVDPLYPGFVEILERNDVDGLVRLARVLSDHPSEESLALLLWMLRYCPSWPSDGVLQIDKTIRAVGRLPLTPVADALRHATADHRVIAAALLSNYDHLIPESDRTLLDNSLIAALQDRDDKVRDMVAAALGGRNSPAAVAAVRQYWAQHETARQAPHAPRRLPTFPPLTLALLESLDPDYTTTLSTLNEPGLRRLLASLQRTRDPAATPVLLWLLENGDTRAYVGNVVYQLGQSDRVAFLSLGALASMLNTAEPERKALIAELFGKIFGSRNPPGAERDRAIAALIECLRVPNVEVRTKAVEALGRAGASQATAPIIRLLAEPDGDRYEMAAARALLGIGGRGVLQPLERLAQTSRSRIVRDEAASAYVAVAKPADPAAELRRLLWEQPDTALEKRVLAGATATLPEAWQALAQGGEDERRAAAALLGWFRDTQSIRPILTALDRAPGALLRQQLLFDLNMILLTEGAEAPRRERNQLATLHLQWLYDQLVNEHIDSDIRATVLTQKTFHVFPDRIEQPFLVPLATKIRGQKPGDAATDISATATVTPSVQAFLDLVRKTGCGVAFHAITASNDVARVASTLYLPKGRIANQVWISLYRRVGDRWVPLPVPSHPVLHRMINEPSLMPTINRDYGPDHPLKILRLDLTMERIRVDLTARPHLTFENRENPIGRSELDSSYVPLLEPYKRSDSVSVKYTAEFESAALTKQPNLPLWIDALSPSSGRAIQEMAVSVLATHVFPSFKTEGRQLDGAERDELVAAALAPELVDPLRAPRVRPTRENVRMVRQWTRFGLVDLVFGSGPRAESGVALLFERRGNRWVFLCVVSSWIS